MTMAQKIRDLPVVLAMMPPNIIMSLFRTPIEKLAKKRLISIQEDATILACAKKMSQYPFGSLVVKRGKEIVGIITEKDILDKAVSKELDLVKYKVKKIMSKKLVHVQHNDTVIKALHLMHKKNLKKILVKKQGSFIGIITQTDTTRLFSLKKQ